MTRDRKWREQLSGALHLARCVQYTGDVVSVVVRRDALASEKSNKPSAGDLRVRPQSTVLLYRTYSLHVLSSTCTICQELTGLL